ncbi:MAG: Unknown protein [uncultured Sulfurovum sp.]|uniref:DUF1737 domain-containing protein n=1 Tax=uncultured Sulfurovum sp. TaxID=269237 RepID=A0A6S6SVS5_9BACT|nr:MAG: Unknown protein [uncultured Sulfurovum sp.]
MTYKILKSDPYKDSIEDFEEAVNKYLKDGWEPTGGIYMRDVYQKSSGVEFTQFFQSITKVD